MKMFMTRYMSILNLIRMKLMKVNGILRKDDEQKNWTWRGIVTDMIHTFVNAGGPIRMTSSVAVSEGKRPKKKQWYRWPNPNTIRWQLLTPQRRKLWHLRRPNSPQTSWQTAKSNIKKAHTIWKTRLVGPHEFLLVIRRSSAHLVSSHLSASVFITPWVPSILFGPRKTDSKVEATSVRVSKGYVSDSSSRNPTLTNRKRCFLWPTLLRIIFSAFSLREGPHTDTSVMIDGNGHADRMNIFRLR
jgi:hypothetical protein